MVFTNQSKAKASAKEALVQKIRQEGIDLKTTNVNDLLKVFGVRSLDR